jgi:hypothetical protein
LPFAISRWGRRYVSRDTFYIDLAQLPKEILQIVAVHDFRIEDRNPNLDECLVGIFIARRIGDWWEESEDQPVECRSIEVLALVDNRAIQILSP